MIEDIRRISQNLSPALLENQGLKDTLKHLLAEFGKYQELTMNIDMEDIQNVFPPQTEINLFIIFQESLNNIAKNAQASIVSVTIKSQDAKVIFCPKDNLVGFYLKQITSKEIADKGFGLLLLRNRCG